jgi:outer membrane protein OmpA-like peptidoglycan-associated protein
MLRALYAAAAMTLIALPAAQRASAQPPVLVVFFPDWSGAIDNAANRVIGQAADLAKSSRGTITVTGYADSTGSSRANVYLTQLRAQRVIDALETDGVPAARLKLVAAGKQAELGVASRRVEIAIPGQ